MKNKILVYDDNCPLCTWYSGLFVKYGFLNAEGRKPFSTLDDKLLAKLTLAKAGMKYHYWIHQHTKWCMVLMHCWRSLTKDPLYKSNWEYCSNKMGFEKILQSRFL
jgi:hypothetical protein